jgi:hypothetical protein
VTTADLTDERLRDFAASDPLVLAICATLGEPSWADVRQNAAELLAARAEIKRLRALLPKLLALLDVARKWENGLASPMELALAVLDVDEPPHKKET